MNIMLRIRYRDAVLVKGELHVLSDVEIHVPVIRRFHPRPNDKIDAFVKSRPYSSVYSFQKRVGCTGLPTVAHLVDTSLSCASKNLPAAVFSGSPVPGDIMFDPDNCQLYNFLRNRPLERLLVLPETKSQRAGSLKELSTLPSQKLATGPERNLMYIEVTRYAKLKER
jgi:hypothetical protein